MRYFRLTKLNGIIQDTPSILDTDDGPSGVKKHLEAMKDEDGMEFEEISKEEFLQLQEIIHFATTPPHSYVMEVDKSN